MSWMEHPEELLELLRELSQHDAASPSSKVLEVSSPRLDVAEYDNWNGGTTYYNLILKVPVPVFVQVEDKLEGIEEAILNRIKKVHREETHDFIATVLVQPIAGGSLVQGQSDGGFWIPSCFRLFISHIGQSLNSALNLRDCLIKYGISCFVAHTDIEPTKEWQIEIVSALGTMDALAAILVPGFGKSNWTDHEVGFALGRGKLVVPIMNGRNPYGLLSKYQGLNAKGKNVKEVSLMVFNALMKNKMTATRLVACIVEQFLIAGDVATGMEKIELLKAAGTISQEHLEKIREKTSNTSTYNEDQATLDMVNTLLATHGFALATKPSRVSSFLDENVPF